MGHQRTLARQKKGGHFAAAWTVAGDDMLTLYHGRFILTASGRCNKGSYVPFESDDIDLK